MFISDDFFDKYCGLVEPIYIVGYLWIERNRAAFVSADDFCDDLGIMSSTLRKILRFWKEQDVLSYTWEDGSDSIHIKLKPKKRSELSLTETKVYDDDPEFVKIMSLLSAAFPKDSRYRTQVAYYYKEGFDSSMFKLLIEYSKNHKAEHVAYLFTVADKLVAGGVTSEDALKAWVDGCWNRIRKYQRYINPDLTPPVTNIRTFRKWMETYTDEQITDALFITGSMADIKNPVSYTEAVLKKKYN